MSEKITFRELIESIAEETGNSKQFTHDFIKDFVDVINNGLEEDGNVNIAGFGKFKLRHMEEREGYNPQTEEKITIPAHNKVVFKPYKDLRELVNAPFAHLEAELIEKQSDDTEAEVVAEDTNTNANEDDFIPTVSPASHPSREEGTTDETESSEIEEAPFDLEDEYDDEGLSSFTFDQEDENEKKPEEEVDLGDPFDLDDDCEEQFSSSDSEQDEETEDDADIVEFDAWAESPSEEKVEAEEKNGLESFITPIEPSQSETTEDSEEQTDDFMEGLPFEEETEDVDELKDSSEEDTAESFSYDEGDTNDFAPIFEDEDEAEEEEDEEQLTSKSIASKRHPRKDISKWPIIAAVAVVLLLVAAAAWYFSSSSSDNTMPLQVAANETASTTNTDATVQKGDHQEPSADKQATTNTAQQNQKQSANTSSANTKTATTSNKRTNSANLEIQEGQTLWSIAEEKYGNPRLWPWIYGNNGSLNNPDLIIAGNSLSVPLPSGPQNTLNSADSVGVAKGFISTYRWYKDNKSAKARYHLWAAKSYHENIQEITDLRIDKADLVYANQAR